MVDTMMDEAQIIEIAREWSYWDRPVPASLARDVTLPQALRSSLCLVIQGVRRCGKSTLLRQMIAHYKLNPMRCLFVNFEDPRLTNHLGHELLTLLVRAFRAQNPRVRRLHFFLDEIQNVPGWERWLRTQLDQGGENYFIVTGSNANMLSGELASALTGRHFSVQLYPFDLGERRIHDPGVRVEDFLNDGGFPEPLDQERTDGDMLLRQYFYDIVERDVRERLRARSGLPIRQLVQMVYESAGSEMSLRRAAGAVGVAVDTASSYLEACEAAYLLFPCPYFAYSERKRASRNRKFYPIDTGLRRVVVTRTGQDLGKSLECAVFLELRRRYSDVYYWRDRGEVDFVVRIDRQVVPIQVSVGEPHERHLRGLESFYERFPQADEAVMVNLDNFAHALAFS